MEPIAKRLKSFLQHKGLTTTAFTRILQYSSCEKVARLFRVPGAKPSVDILEDIAKHFEELNLRWLITGHGEMLRVSATHTQPQPHPETEMTAAIQQEQKEHDPNLVFIKTANNDEYILHQPFPSFLLKGSEKEMEKTSKPLLGSLINFIENVRDEQ
ncbi:hypothetical protein GFS24_27900 [Chitinophaga sp. SYP-B3965]|uniref:hypothetical protein n=1 Tax=Chitinophaga sp. SYP-B3965 TaxID=2663120 RepID=UPI001299E9DE|nr:hypothetical protein [Chitinophaga sp. SYP-B3965]MRG48966.1 hypothetical protein [Chitinophaga sp. SYP-B3965]